MFAIKISMCLVLIILTLSSYIEFGQTSCVMYGQCNENSDGIQNCYTDEIVLPTTLNRSASNYNQAVSNLKSYCPEFYEDSDDPEVCCDTDQVVTMAESMALSEVFSRCPTCLKNLLGSICGFSCSPNQSDFMKVLKYSTENGTYNKGPYIEEISVELSEIYMNTTYNSCVGVSMPSTGGVVMDSACGSWSSTYCTPKRWFHYMGVENPFVPFPIYYIASSNSTALTPKSVPCNEQYNNETSACSCVDCSVSCINGEFEALTSNYFKVGNLFGPTFVVSIILIVFSFIFTFIIVIKRRVYQETPKTNKRNDDNKKNMCSLSIGIIFQKGIQSFFYKLGIFVVNHSAIVLFLWSWIIAALTYGVIYLSVTTNTVELWASPTSQSRLEKDYFDTYFGPFYRTEQVYIKTVDIDNVLYNSTSEGLIYVGPVFNKTFLLAVFELQKQLENITLSDGSGLETICYAPVLNAFSDPITINDCTIQSLLGYFGNDISTFDSNSDYIATMEACFTSPYTIDCLAPYGGPILPGIAVGGGDNYMSSNGLALTFIVKNSVDSSDNQPAMEWEKKFISFLEDWDENSRPSFMSIAYSSERSIEDEISRLSYSEAATVILSYLIMFVYILISLGRFRSCRTICIDSKITLAFGGIVLVLCSVACSLGTGGYFGSTITLLTIEVIPFITLAVGVDNLFIITQTYQDNLGNKDLTHKERVAQTLSSVGPSILLTSISEIFCFGLGALSTMPAVHTFALFATLSLIYGFLLQITAFVALLSLDGERYLLNRFDICCCVKIEKKEKDDGKSWVDYIWSEICIPIIMKFEVRCAVLFVFSLLFAVNVMLAPSVELGLDQQLSMPDDSHVIKYFQYMYDLLGVGSPIYWVTRGNLNYTDEEIQNKFCGSTGCLTYSVATQLYTASQQSEITYISTQASSWIDDYKDWSELSTCCKYFYSNNSFCPHTYSSSLCGSCSISTLNITWEEYFPRYLSYFLQDNSDTTCAKGGNAAYADGIDYFLDDDGKANITSAYVMNYHTVLKDSKDYYEALRYARIVAKNLTETIGIEGVEIFPYSVFYVYYEQYLTVWMEMIQSTGYSLMAVLIVSFIFSGFDIFTACVIVLTCLMILVSEVAFMYYLGITLNAVSVVNLVITIGISVEFCGHMVYAYKKSIAETPVEKTKETLIKIGSKVLCGITFTKFFGIIVLAFANSQIFRIFYFKMYLIMIISGALHGLVFLPALLCILGQLLNH